MDYSAEMKDEDKKWPDQAVIEFLRILSDRVKTSNDGNPTFKLSEYSDMDREMVARVGMSYGADKLKGKYNRLKLMYKNFSELLSHTGVTYNPTTNTVNACDDTWEKFIKKKPKLYKSFKKNGCKHYQLMDEVFARSVATGGLANSSAQMPQDSDDERLQENEFLRSARPSSTANDTGGSNSKGKRSLDEMMDVSGSTKRSTTKRMKDEVTSVLKTMGAVMSAKEERRRARHEEGSTTNTANATQYSMAACMEILKTMPGLPNATYARAFQKLESPIMREGFVQMLPEWRLEWLLSLQ